MEKISTLVESFTDANKQLCKSRPAVEPRDIYLAYCALALCTIADKMEKEVRPMTPTLKPCPFCGGKDEGMRKPEDIKIGDKTLAEVIENHKHW